MEKLVSIIVPVYNVEQFLERCISSLQKQTYKNLEIILVDDGSTDNSGNICDNFSASDERVLSIHKSNGGLSSARNAGLDVAKGEYITFVDSDDFLHIQSVENMMKYLLQGNHKIIRMDSNLIDLEGNITHCSSKNTFSVTNINPLLYIEKMCKKKLPSSACGVIFSAEITNKYRFCEERLNEDFLFLSNILLADYEIALLDFAGYYYCKRNNSITNDKKDYRSLKDAIKNSYELMLLAETEKKELAKDFAYSTVFQAKSYFSLINYSVIKNKTTDFLNILFMVKACLKYWGEADLKIYDKIIIKGFIFMPKTTKICLDIVRKKILKK